MFSRASAAIILLAALTFVQLPKANAEPLSSLESRVMLKALTYVRGINMENGLTIALVYDENDPDSTQRAEIYAKNLTQNAHLAPVEINIIKIPDLNSKLPPQVMVLPVLSEAKLKQVSQFAKQHQILSMTNDIDCVKKARCVLGVDVSHGVDIYLSEQAMLETGVDFDAAFKFMVKRF